MSPPTGESSRKLRSHKAAAKDTNTKMDPPTSASSIPSTGSAPEAAAFHLNSDHSSVGPPLPSIESDNDFGGLVAHQYPALDSFEFQSYPSSISGTYPLRTEQQFQLQPIPPRSGIGIPSDLPTDAGAPAPLSSTVTNKSSTHSRALAPLDVNTSAPSSRKSRKAKGRSTKAEKPSFPLICVVCNKQTFSDLSHLLTHCSSRAHNQRVFYMSTCAQSDGEAANIISEYQNWLAESGVGRQLHKRVQDKKIKDETKMAEAEKRKKGMGKKAPAVSKKMKGESAKFEADTANSLESQLRGLARKPELFRPELDDTPLPTTPGSNYSDDDKFADIEDDEDISPSRIHLKGTFWPGMNLFDAATPENRKKRNQRKDRSVIDRMRAASEQIEPTETVADMNLDYERTRNVYDSPSEYEDTPKSRSKKSSVRRAPSVTKTPSKKLPKAKSTPVKPSPRSTPSKTPKKTVSRISTISKANRKAKPAAEAPVPEGSKRRQLRGSAARAQTRISEQAQKEIEAEAEEKKQEALKTEENSQPALTSPEDHELVTLSREIKERPESVASGDFDLEAIPLKQGKMDIADETGSTEEVVEMSEIPMNDAQPGSRSEEVKHPFDMFDMGYMAPQHNAHMMSMSMGSDSLGTQQWEDPSLALDFPQLGLTHGYGAGAGYFNMNAMGLSSQSNPYSEGSGNYPTTTSMLRTTAPPPAYWQNMGDGAPGSLSNMPANAYLNAGWAAHSGSQTEDYRSNNFYDEL